MHINSIIVSEHEKMPKVAHWAILSSSSVTTEGDERSRMYPGHGYPAHTTYYCVYHAFLKKSDWEAACVEETTKGEKFVAMYVCPATITSSIKVNIN